MRYLMTTTKEMIPKSHFLHRLWIEKRRADRSKSPFSIVSFCYQQGLSEQGDVIQNFLTSLNCETRETDVKGWIDHNVIGLILPDTDTKGVQCFVNKILNGNGEKSFSVTTGTYPDDIINKLLNEKQGGQDFFPLDIDETGKSKVLQSHLKRLMDIIGSLIGILLFSPIMILTAIAIKITSSGPIIFKQFRLGTRGIRFSFYKFRSMDWNVGDQIHRDYVANLIQGDLKKINQGDKETPLYKMKSDPRVTPVGKIIRKTSIDELPQFFNVLMGEMSLVGPRPPIPYEVEKYEPWHLRRILEVKPGITGLWQVDGRSKTSFDDMVRLDLRYAQNWSLWLDLKILLKTVRAVIRSQGAL